MKSRNIQIAYFVTFSICFVLFANVKTKSNGTNYNIIWDSNDKITTDALVSNDDSQNLDNKIRSEHTKEHIKLIIKENAKTPNFVLNLLKKENMLSKMSKNEEKNTEADNAKVSKKVELDNINKQNVPKEVKVNTNLFEKKSLNKAIQKKFSSKSHNAITDSTKVTEESRKANVQTIVPTKSILIANKVDGSSSNIAKFSVEKRGKKETFKSNKKTNHPGIKYERVQYVKQLSPAGKAALEAQESGE